MTFCHLRAMLQSHDSGNCQKKFGTICIAPPKKLFQQVRLQFYQIDSNGSLCDLLRHRNEIRLVENKSKY